MGVHYSEERLRDTDAFKRLGERGGAVQVFPRRGEGLAVGIICFSSNNGER